MHSPSRPEVVAYNYRITMDIPAMFSYKKLKGFTLIELLLVIGIISVLAGIVLAVINPARQRQRSEEAVMRGNLTKVCQSLLACASAQSTVNNALCDTFDEVGALVPDRPIGATYNVGMGASWLHAYGTTAGGCRMACVINNDMSDWAGGNPGIVFANTGTNYANPGGGNPGSTANCVTN